MFGLQNIQAASTAMAALIAPLGMALVTIAALWIVRRIAFKLFGRWSRRTETKLDDIVLRATRWPSFVWIIVFGALIALRSMSLAEGLRSVVQTVLVALLIFSITLVVARLLAGIFQHYSDRLAPEVAVATAGVTKTLVNVVVFILGGLIFLGTLGIDISPLLGALGVGGLAVGLALQGTLSNLFAGFHVVMARQIRPGQRIRLDSGEEGYVTDVGWRTTTLRTPVNTLIIIPNAKLAEAIITNLDMPDRPFNVVLTVSVAYHSDTRHVEDVLADEARKLREELAPCVKEFEPIVRFHAMSDFSLNFLVILRLESFDSQFAVWNEIHHRLFNRLKTEGIEIPFPVRTVYLRQEGAPSEPPPP